MTSSHLHVSVLQKSSQSSEAHPEITSHIRAVQSRQPMPSEDDESRFAMELELLKAMYPDQIAYDAKSRDLKFTADGGALLQLRIPETYPESGFPDVLGARDAQKNDLREQVRSAIKDDLGLAEGEEALDAIIACFQSVVDARGASANVEEDATEPSDASDTAAPSKTVIIWLHHLLALSKRKLALSPPSISGITKPGYPGVMIFSGPGSAVADHVNTLKAENWQAFQVRYEEHELWEFEHGHGIREVETMAQVVKDLGNENRREEFLKAVGIK